MKMQDMTVGFLVGGVVLVLALAAPWLFFWSIGVLFGFHIQLTWKTWLAAMVFLGLVRGGGTK